MDANKWALAISGPYSGREVEPRAGARITLHASKEAAYEALWQYVLAQCNGAEEQRLREMDADEGVDRDEVISEVMEDEREEWIIGEVWE